MNRLKKRCQVFARAVPPLVAGLSVAAAAVSFSHGQGFTGELREVGGIGLVPAMTFLLCSLSLWQRIRSPSTAHHHSMAKALGAVVCLIGVIGIIHRLSNGQIGFAFPGGLTFQESLGVLLLGLALASLRWTIRRTIHPAEFFAFGAATLAGVALLNVVYRMGLPGALDGAIRMRVSAALIILILALGILCAWTRSGLMPVLINNTGHARLLRRLLLILAVTLPMIGWLPLSLQQEGWYRSEFGVALLVMGSLGVFVPAVLAVGANLLMTEMLQRRAEHRRKLRDADFIATFEQAAVGIAHVATSGRFLRTNQRLSTILGYSREEFLKLTFQDITYRADLELDLLYFRKILKGEISRYTTEKRYIRKDGTTVWGNLTVAVLRKPSGKPKYFISVVEDITNWKRAQEELKAANKAKDRFISVISHELRTPLTPVLAALSGEPGQRGKGSSVHLDPATVEMMRRNIEHEASIINDLLDLTRISSSGKLKLELRPVDLHALIREVVQGVESAMEKKGLTSLLLLDAPNYVVDADPIRLRQIFLNLIDNAMKFTPRGGAITIATSAGRERGGVDPIDIRVSDTGVGIEPEYLEKIFDAFEQGKRASARRHGGLGLGLAIVRGLVEAHGGEIHAISTGKGATFHFDLCLSGKPVEPPLILREGETQHAQILLVEDHEDTRITLKKLLERRGHFVLTAASLADAVELARRLPFDLVISDIGLPDGSGLEIPAALSSGGLLPCVALSGFGTEDDIRKSLQAGFLHHLTKPVEMPALDDLIARILNRKKAEKAKGIEEETEET